MATRALQPPRDPEAVALAALALRNYVTPVAAPTQFEEDTAAQLKALGLKKTAAKTLLDNFDRIKPSIRKEHLGNLGVATEAPKKAPAMRDPNTVTTEHVVIPKLTLRRPLRELELPQPVGTAPHPHPAQPVPPAIDYTISYEGMHCVDETHWDFLGSDEIYIITTAVHISPGGKNVVRTERHPITGPKDYYGDVDTGETRVGPRAACWNGVVAQVSAGMSLTAVVFEHDKGDPDAYLDEVDAGVKLAIAVVRKMYPEADAILKLVEESGLVTDLVNWFLSTGDDRLSTITTLLELPDLEGYSRSHISPLGKTTLNYHFLARSSSYISAYRVLRNPVAPEFPLGPVG
jgi:hypothetical protein